MSAVIPRIAIAYSEADISPFLFIRSYALSYNAEASPATESYNPSGTPSVLTVAKLEI